MIVLTGIVAWMTIPTLSGVEVRVVNMPAMGSENVKAQFKKIIEEGEIDLDATLQRYQVMIGSRPDLLLYRFCPQGGVALKMEADSWSRRERDVA